MIIFILLVEVFEDLLYVEVVLLHEVLQVAEDLLQLGRQRRLARHDRLVHLAKKWVLEDFVPADALRLLHHEAPLDEVLRLLRDNLLVGEAQRHLLDAFPVAVDVSARPRTASEQHVVVEEPD